MALPAGALLGKQPTVTSGVLAPSTRWQTPYYIVDSGVAGPTVLLTGGLHGNEPAGAYAADQIRYWPLKRGKLVVVPRVNAPGLRQRTRWLPGEPEPLRNLNRNFPKSGQPNQARGELARRLWQFVQKLHPDWVVDLHEGFDFHIANSASDGSSIIFFDSPAMRRLAAKIQQEVNATVSDPKRRFVLLARSGPIDGGLVRAAVERLGARGFCFETTFQYQPVSLRVRQLRLMVHCLLEQLEMIDRDVPLLARPAPAEMICAALFDGGGTSSRGVRNVEKFFARQPNLAFCHVGPEDIRDGALRNMDVVIFPGGSGSRQATALGEQGRRRVQQFVRDGGGYIGICAGAYLAAANYRWSLALANVKTFTGTREIPGVGRRSMWRRGSGTVKVKLTAEGRQLFGTLPATLDVYYQNGPILSQHNKTDLPPYTVLARFASEVALYEPQKGTMVDAPAVLTSCYGRGRVVLVSPHPEASAKLDPLLRRLLELTAGRCQLPAVPLPATSPATSHDATSRRAPLPELQAAP